MNPETAKNTDKTIITILTYVVATLAIIATLSGILSKKGPGRWMHESVRGFQVEIYGEGIYRHMSADVAPQEIAQDFVTLIIGIPLLLFALQAFRKNSLKGRFLLAGVQAYFLVTYLYYLTMGTFNALFLIYVALLGCTFFIFLLTLPVMSINELPNWFSDKIPARSAGNFLIFNALIIALLWLSLVVPPLIEGTIIPRATQHYTTLIVQGFDLALLLPASLIIGIMLKRKTPAGLMFGTVYLVFLSLLMVALTAKIIALHRIGEGTFPASVIIPVITIIAIILSIKMIKSIRKRPKEIS
jgi:hypothetical protein